MPAAHIHPPHNAKRAPGANPQPAPQLQPQPHPQTTSHAKRTLDPNAKVKPISRIAWLNPAWLVIASAVALSFIGITTINLATGGADATGARFGLSPLALRQLVFLAVGIIAATIAVIPHPRRIQSLTWLIGALTIALLIFVLLPFIPEEIVKPRKGSRRWISLGVADFQPSELAKVAYVLALATYLRLRSNHRTLLGLIPPALMAFVPMALILVEPDLGTSLLFIPTLVIMLIAAGAKLWHLMATGIAGLSFAALIVVVSLVAAERDAYPLLRPHQVNRILAVMDLYTGDTRFIDDRAFQGRQAVKIAGAGGLAGHDTERTEALIRFNPLPEKHNDMIFPVILNRYGFIGGLAVIGAYALWVLGALWTAALSKDPFGRLVCVGLGGIVAIQASINIGMTLGLLPITGITLPLISYGGSSLLIAWTMAGLILGIGLRRPAYFWRKSFEFND